MAENFSDFIEFAIKEEQRAADLYEKYSNIASARSTQEILKSMAAMERGHEAKLKKVLEKGITLEVSTLSKPGSVEDMKLSDYMISPTLTENSDIQDVFIFAMKAEESAYELYSELASVHSNDEIKKIFDQLAAEEKKHKLDLESEYESIFMKEN